MADDGNWDPAQASSLEELTRCLEHLHDRAGRPSTRAVQAKTKHANGTLPGTNLPRVPLGRNAISEMLSGQKFPRRKEFFLTFVDTCGVNLETDRSWDEAWDRLYLQRRGRQNHAATVEVERLRQQLAGIQQELAEVLHAADADRARAEQLTEALNAERQHRQEAETHPHRPGRKPARPGKHARASVAQLLGLASRAALETREQQPMVTMLAELARACEEFDPGQAQELLGTAEGAAGLIRDPYDRALAFAAVASVIAASNQAESVRQPKSARLFDAAEGAASVIPKTEQSKALAIIVQMMADSDPDRAKNIAWKISDPNQKAWAVAFVVKALARSDPVQAEALAKSITSKWQKSWALIALVEAARELDRTDDVARRLGVPVTMDPSASLERPVS